MDWLDLLAVQGTLKSLLQHHSSKAPILRRSAFFTVQLSHPYMITGKTIALTRWTFVVKTMSLLLTMLSRLVITFLPRSMHLLISWLQSPSVAVLYSPNFKQAYGWREYSNIPRYLGAECVHMARFWPLRYPWKWHVQILVIFLKSKFLLIFFPSSC